MRKLWIVTANQSFAKVFEATGHGHQIKEIHHFENPDGRKKAGELVSDRPGRTFDRMGEGRHAYSQEVSIKERVQQEFARKLASALQSGHEAKQFEELAIVAPEHFLGALNQEISDHVKKKVIKEAAKDLPEYLSEQERIDLLCKYLDLWNYTR